MFRYRSILLILGALCLLAGPAGAQSLLKNGDFEGATMEPWAEWRWAGDCAAVVDKTFHHGGKQSLRLEGSGGCKVGLHQALGNVPAGLYRLTGYVRAINLQEGQWKRTCLISIEDGDKELVQDNFPRGTYDWRPFTRIYKLDELKKGALFFYIFNTARVWLDDLRLEPISEAPAGKPELTLGPEAGLLSQAIAQGVGLHCPFCGAVKPNEAAPCPTCGYVVTRPERFDTDYYVTEGPNLIKNGDFEAAGEGTRCPFAGWVGRQMLGGEYSFELVPGHAGKAARITGTKAGRGDIHNAEGFKVKAGSMLRVRFWARTEGLNGGVFANLEGEPNDNGWKKINIDNTTEWKPYETFVKVPPGAAGQQEPAILIWFYNFGTGSLLIDDIDAYVVKPDPAGKARAELAQLKEFAGVGLQGAAPARVKSACQAVLRQIDATLKNPTPDAVPPLRRQLFAALGGLFGGDGSFTVGVASPLEKVFLDEPYRAGFAPEMHIALARNESEGAQVVVLSNGKPLKGVSVALEGDLKGAGGRTLPASQVRLDLEGYVDTSFGPRPYQSPKLGWWPDPLLPNAPFDVRAGESQPVLVTVTTSEQTAPGAYRGNLLITCGRTKAKLPLSVEVFPFALPTRGHYPSLSFGCSPDIVARHYGGDPGQKIMERFVVEACKRRLPPTSMLNGWAWGGPKAKKRPDGTYDFTELDRWIDLYQANGVTRFPMVQAPRFRKFGGGDYNDRFKTEFGAFIKAYAAHLKEKGIFDAAVMYNIDEASDSLKEWDACRDLYRITKEAAPDLPVVQCLNEPKGVQALAGSVDIWDFYPGQFEQAGGPERVKAGDGVMLAVCIWPSEHPNLFIEYPLLDARILPWIGERVGARGFEYWEMFTWGDNIGKRDWLKAGDGTRTAWRLERPHGDGLLMYPGPDGTPLSSLRLEAIRDGLEDYDYLYLLSERAKTDAKAAALLQEATQQLVTGVTSYDRDPNKLLDLRLRIGRLLGGR